MKPLQKITPPARHRLRTIARTLIGIGLASILAGCGGPSRDDVVSATGHPGIRDLSCAPANGQPGYVCTYFDTSITVTARFVKLDNGRWDVIYAR
ncbi:hypothetical protein [Bradyrhizobium sp. UNPF46]|uniref:hypothetical protein n=1 Tax=Bradyrhizobium sp. UNPF46 TaxID=1141168 RepID=UPI00114ECD8B|nr:hypothetical protein [Bradyrhizobium sp. UNPF46]